MYVILVYDIGVKRVGKMLRLCRRYLNWIQNSVFEGELNAVQLRELESEAKKIMNTKEDSLILFTSTNTSWLEKRIIGQERNHLDHFL